jgi:hypothetical protein
MIYHLAQIGTRTMAALAQYEKDEGTGVNMSGAAVGVTMGRR